MKTMALVAALLLATLGTAHAQGGPDGSVGAPAAAGGPAGGSMEGPAGPGGGAPEAGGAPGGGGPEGGPAARAPAEGLGDGPAAARDAPPAREARERPAADTDRGRADTERPRRAREAADDGGPKAEGKARKAAERAKSDDDKSGAKSDGKPDAQARNKKADDPAKQAKENAKQGKEGVSQPEKDADAARAAKPERAKQVELSGEKRTRVETALKSRSDVKRHTDVDVDISIGRRLPRDWHFVPVPIAVVEIVPEYRDYVYVWVEDEYVICDPVTYEVVAVLPAGGDDYASSGSGSSCSTRITLSDDQRELILDTVRLGREVDVADLRVGWSVPGDIELERFPEQVLSEADELSACRYFVADDQLAIVDPEADKVVLLIDKS
jgi:hypothetical protein